MTQKWSGSIFFFTPNCACRDRFYSVPLFSVELRRWLPAKPWNGTHINLEEALAIISWSRLNFQYVTLLERKLCAWYLIFLMSWQLIFTRKVYGSIFTNEVNNYIILWELDLDIHIYLKRTHSCQTSSILNLTFWVTKHFSKVVRNLFYITCQYFIVIDLRYK